jgi:hypothetical protein
MKTVFSRLMVCRSTPRRAPGRRRRLAVARYFDTEKNPETGKGSPKCCVLPPTILLIGMVRVRATPIRPIVSIGPRGAGRQRGNRGYAARLHIDGAAVVINDGRRAAGTYHDRVADIGAGMSGDRFEALALIDRQAALARLNADRPGRTANQHGAPNTQCPKEPALFVHEVPPQT